MSSIRSHLSLVLLLLVLLATVLAGTVWGLPISRLDDRVLRRSGEGGGGRSYPLPEPGQKRYIRYSDRPPRVALPLPPPKLWGPGPHVSQPLPRPPQNSRAATRTALPVVEGARSYPLPEPGQTRFIRYSDRPARVPLPLPPS
ncbi:uncharacterized protein PFL1_04460 [Pseudozyma flocculosa PF-1]|uniref:Uncharacterized protein n=1 Tax=Pseudozyma flocculosa PF-1 TaxID=1277687 RepID=A0A061H685_9BASI|nr:uncharacterized protein PFL1_04460 [Pseudozyma flocculosa PF-1]EPQ28133.1 hypothetical protein PFL1_04460 [Pseudozyma flocculosa PF-1]